MEAWAIQVILACAAVIGGGISWRLNSLHAKNEKLEERLRSLEDEKAQTKILAVQLAHTNEKLGTLPKIQSDLNVAFERIRALTPRD